MKPLPMPAERIEIEEAEGFLMVAACPAAGHPWVWYAPTLTGQYPGKEENWMFERFLSTGIAIAGVDIGESYGSPIGVSLFTRLYQELVSSRGMSPKPALLARSRGGLMHYNWAVENPDKLSGIAGIYTVGNLASWPGLKRAAPAYEMTADELKEQLPKHNPVDRLATLAKAKVPIYHIHGDNDKVVPLEHNAGLLVKRYKKLDGPATIEVIPGGGHDLKDHWFQSQTLTDFMIEKALGIKKKAKR